MFTATVAEHFRSGDLAATVPQRFAAGLAKWLNISEADVVVLDFNETTGIIRFQIATSTPEGAAAQSQLVALAGGAAADAETLVQLDMTSLLAAPTDGPPVTPRPETMPPPTTTAAAPPSASSPPPSTALIAAIVVIGVLGLLAAAAVIVLRKLRRDRMRKTQLVRDSINEPRPHQSASELDADDERGGDVAKT